MSKNLARRPFGMSTQLYRSQRLTQAHLLEASADKPGDLAEAIETVAGHLTAMRVPIDERIDWPSALTTIQKVGYDRALIFDGTPKGSPKETLARARAAREKMERWLTST
jgi:hypothetical protein